MFRKRIATRSVGAKQMQKKLHSLKCSLSNVAESKNIVSWGNRATIWVFIHERVTDFRDAHENEHVSHKLCLKQLKQSYIG